MTVNGIRLTNFMAFRDTGWIDLKAITLLFGLNSSGKSVIIRALRLLKQSLEFPAEDDLFTYSMSEGVDVDSFLSMCNGQNKKVYKDNKKGVKISFRCDVRTEYLSYLGIASDNAQSDKFEVDFSVSYSWNQKRGTAELTMFSLEISPNSPTRQEKKLILQVEVEDFIEESIFGNQKLIYQTDFLDVYNEYAVYWNSVALYSDPPFLPRLRHEVLSDESTDDFNFIDRLLGELRVQVMKFLRGIIHVGPTRPSPSRLYTLNSWEQKIWEDRGLGAYLELLRGKSYKDINNWMSKLGFGHLEKPKSFSKFSDKAIVTELSVQQGVRNIGLPDVGFGVSQTLPVIMASLLSTSETTTIIEQPELHLHPAAQAELADIFILSALQNDTKFVLETHSEHLILRIMKRIKQTFIDDLPSNFPKVGPEIISVNVISRPKNRSYSDINKMRFSKDGELLTPWPGGFFEEDFNERFF